jgi:voltage-dependent potassium channel beta subunit
MLYRRLGKSGLKISALSFGSWVTFGTQVDESLGRELMSAAYDHGVNFFDNAEVYADGESERIMGQALKKLAWGRDTYCVSSKVFWGGEKPTQMGLSRKHVFDACHAALKRLQVDYLDLFFCHRADITTPIEETVWAMHNLVTQGKILYWGTSEWNAQQITEAHAVARANHLTPPTMEQPEYNLFSREKVEGDFQRLYDTVGLGTTIWSPLSSGVLTGKYNEGVPQGSRLTLKGYEWLRQRYSGDEGRQRIEKVRKLAPIAQSIDASMAQLAIAWCLKNPNVSSVILGASKRPQLDENLKALQIADRLTPEVMARIEEVMQNKPAPLEDLTA